MYHRIASQERLIHRIAGISPSTFKKMKDIVGEYRKNQEKRKWWKELCGRNHTLSIEDQVLLCMIYMRSYTTYLFLGSMFQISETTAWRVHREIEVILIRSGWFSLPKKALLQQTLDSVLIDATESPIERPKPKDTGRKNGRRKSIQRRKVRLYL